MGLGLPRCLSGYKESVCNAGDMGFIPGLGRSPGGGRGNPLQYSCLENPTDKRSLVGYSPWAHKESNSTEATEHARTQVGISRKIKQEREIMSTRHTGSSHYFITVLLGYQFNSIQSLSHVWLFATSWTAAYQASLSITKSQTLLKLMSIESVMPSNHLILCRPLLLLPSVFPSIRVGVCLLVF